MNILFEFINDYEEEERKALLKRERLLLRTRNDVWELPEREFIKMFRVNKHLFEMLVTELTPLMDAGQRSTKVPIDLRILYALRFCATGSYQKCVGANHNVAVAQQTVSKYLTEVAEGLQELAQHWIQFPITEEEENDTKRGFMEKFQFPGVVGVVDGTHIAILRPAEHEHLYFNRKHFHSKNVQIICNSDLLILSVNANYAGASHDAFVWSMSNVRGVLERNYHAGNRRTWLLGDSGYPLEPWLLTPITNTLPNTPQRMYDDHLARARNCVERCIGILKNRFRCLLKERALRYDPHKVGLIVNACCVLHNMCVRRQLPLILEDGDVFIDDDNDNAQLNVPPRFDAHREGQNHRNFVVDTYFNYSTICRD